MTMQTNGLELRGLDDVERLAKIAVASGFTACRRVEEAVVVLMTGHELGLSPMQSLRGIYVVSGKPVLSADLMVAVVRKSGLCESWRVVESTADRCEIWTLRRGEDTVAKRVWTMADAKRAGITGKQTWAAYPAAMLRHRCASDLAREVYPDVLLGLYDPEEMGADAPAPTTTVPVSGVATITPESFAALGVEQPRRVLDAPAEPASSWSVDLAACSTLADVRACYSTHRTPDTDGAAMVADVRAWCDSRGLHLDAAGITAALSTLPVDALRCLDASCGSREAIVSAARTCRAATWPEHATRTVWSALARAFAASLGAKSVKVAAETLRAACEGDDDKPPPTGTDGPRSAANDTAATGHAAGHAAPADGASASIVDQIATAWSRSMPGITEHVAAITSARHLEASARAHLGAVSPSLRLHAMHAYTARLRELLRREETDESGERVVTTLDQSVAFARVEGWLREGPRVRRAA